MITRNNFIRLDHYRPVPTFAAGRSFRRPASQCT